MKRFISIVCILISLAAWAADPKVPTLADKPFTLFVPPKVENYVFPNGVKLFFLKRRDLPLFEIQAMIDVGGHDDPQERVGLTGMMMSALHTGGTGKRTPQEVDERIDAIAAKVSVGSTWEYSTFHIGSLSQDMSAAMDLFWDMLKNPRFDPEELETVRKQALDEISRRNEEARDIAGRKYRQVIYGKDNIWARVSTLKSLSAIKRGDIQRHYQQYVNPHRVTLAVSTDSSLRQIIKRLEPSMEGWNGLSQSKLARPLLQKIWTPSIHFVGKDVNQSNIMMGHFGEKRFNPDKYAIVLANEVLGGSTFGARLGNRIRTQLGLAYSVQSSYSLTTDYGIFSMGASTKTASTLQVIQECRKILGDMMDKQPVTASELEDARKVILNQLVFEYEDPFSLVKSAAYYDYYGYPPNYLMIYQDEIKKVTLTQVQEVLRKYFYPGRLKVLVVGDPSLKQKLSSLGKVTALPLDLE